MFLALSQSSTGYISVSQTEDGEYVLRAQSRLLGGGPVLSFIFGWGVRAACYGTAAAGATVVVIGTGVVAGAATGAAVVGGAIAGAGLAAEAGLATVTVVAGTGGETGAIAFVEGLAFSAFCLGAAIPWF